MKQVSGFSLVELMVTIVIGSILGSIALTSFRHYKFKAYRSESVTHLSNMHKWLMMHFTDTGTLPPVTGSNQLCSTGVVCTSIGYNIDYAATKYNYYYAMNANPPAFAIYAEAKEEWNVQHVIGENVAYAIPVIEFEMTKDGARVSGGNPNPQQIYDDIAKKEADSYPGKEFPGIDTAKVVLEIGCDAIGASWTTYTNGQCL